MADYDRISAARDEVVEALTLVRLEVEQDGKSADDHAHLLKAEEVLRTARNELMEHLDVLYDEWVTESPGI